MRRSARAGAPQRTRLSPLLVLLAACDWSLHRMQEPVGCTVNGATDLLPNGSCDLDPPADIVAIVTGESAAPTFDAPDTSAAMPIVEEPRSQPSLEADVAEHRTRFDAALEARNVDEAVAALLDVEQSIQAWSADTLQSDAVDRARRELRAMVVRLGELAKAGVTDPTDVVAPVVEAVLDARRRARDAKDFAVSDLLRDLLTSAGVQVNDTPEGATWEFRPA